MINQIKPDRIWEPAGSDHDKDGNKYITWASHPRSATCPCERCGAHCTAERLSEHEKNCK